MNYILKDELVKKVIYEVLRWVLEGVDAAYVVEYLRKLPNDYVEEAVGITNVYVEARLAKYDEDTVSRVRHIVQYVLPAYVLSRMEGENTAAGVVRKLEEKYGVTIKL